MPRWTDADNCVTCRDGAGSRLLGGVMARPCSTDRGFTIFELMVVLAIIAILVVMAIPLFVSTRVTAAKRTCFANQRELEGMAAVWVFGGSGRQLSDLTGVVDSAHPLAKELAGKRPPRCPAAGDVADPLDPTVGEGAYTFDASGTVEPCTFGDLGPHNHY